MTEGSDRGGLGKTMETISTNILIENPKTQDKNESNLNLPNNNNNNNNNNNKKNQLKVTFHTQI